MITIGNCGNSWGIYRDWSQMQMPWKRFLNEFQAAGYKYLEMAPYGYLPTDAAIVNDELQSRGIVPVAMAIIYPFEQNDNMSWAIEQTHRICRLLKDIGGKYYVYMDGSYRDMEGKYIRPKELNHEAWQVFVANVNLLSKIAREEYGLEPVFHHHADMCVEYEAQIDHFLDMTDSGLVNLLLDTGHYAYRNANLIEFIQSHGSRIRYVHLKNINQPVIDEINAKDLQMVEGVKLGAFAPIEQGSIDFVQVKDALNAIGYDGYAMLECDVHTRDYDSLTPIQIRTRDYLAAIEFGRFV